MTANTQCDVCDPITKYDIRETTEVEVEVDRSPSSIPPFIGDDLPDTDDPFDILNPTADKLLARELGRKTEFDEEIVSTVSDSIILIGNYSSGQLFDNFDRITSELNRLRAVDFELRFAQELNRRLVEKARAVAAELRIDSDKLLNNYRKILSSDPSTKQFINEVFDAKIPEEQLETDQNLRDCLDKADFRNIAAVANAMTANDGFSSALAGASGATDTSQNQFVNPLGKIQQLIQLAQTVIGILNTLNTAMSSSNFQNAPSEDRDNNVSMLQQLPGLLQNFNQFGKQVDSTINQFRNMQLNPRLLNEIVNLRNDIEGKTGFIQKIATEITNINDPSKLAEPNALFGDISKMLQQEIFGKTSNDVQQLMSELQGKIGEAQGAIATDADKEEIANSRDKGKPLGKFLSALVLGQAIPTIIQANNPMLSAPSYWGRAFFGEALNALPAMDQMFARKVANFRNPEGGAGLSAFNFQNLPLGNAAPLGDVIGKLLNIPSQVTSNPLAQNILNQFGNDVGNILGAGINSVVQLNKADNAIPIMIGMASRLSGDTASPFPTSVFSKGWKAASLARGIVERHNTGMLNEVFEIAKQVEDLTRA